MWISALITPFSILNAAVLIISVTFAIRAATESIDYIKDLSPIVRKIVMEPKVFFVKQYPEEVELKNYLLAIGYVGLTFLLIHTVVNIITSHLRTICDPLLFIRVICEHITSLMRIFFFLLGCLIFIAIVLADLSICMPTPTYHNYLPTADSIKISKRFVRSVNYMDIANDFLICEQCCQQTNADNVCIHDDDTICVNLNYTWIPHADELFEQELSEDDSCEMDSAACDELLYIVCNAEDAYDTPESVWNSKNKIHIKFKRDSKNSDGTPKEDKEEKYDGILFGINKGHYQKCQLVQEMMPPGLFWVGVVLLCVSLTLIMSRCEQKQQSKCYCSSSRCCACPQGVHGAR